MSCCCTQKKKKSKELLIQNNCDSPPGKKLNSIESGKQNITKEENTNSELFGHQQSFERLKLKLQSEQIYSSREYIQDIQEAELTFGNEFRLLFEKSIMTKLMSSGITSSTPRYLISIQWAALYTDYLSQKQASPLPNLDNFIIREQLQNGIQLLDDVQVVSVSDIIWDILTFFYSPNYEILVDKLNISIIKSETEHTIGYQADPNQTEWWRAMESQNSQNQFKFESKTTTELVEVRSSLKLKVDSDVPPIGLENPFQFCYLNAGLQCLFTCTQFSHYFLQKSYNQLEHKPKKQLKFSSALSDILNRMLEAQAKTYVSQQTLRSLIRNHFNNFQQHDCQEFIRFILNEISDELNPQKPKHKEIVSKSSQDAWQQFCSYNFCIVDQLFAGQLISRITCTSCNTVINNYEIFYDLSVSLPNSSLDDCFDQFFAEEVITDGYFCEKCKKKKCKKQYWMSRLPKYLVIHLKRFSFTPFKKKISNFVSFPLKDLSLLKFMESQEETRALYKLKAMTIHQGNANSGHYQSIGNRNNIWYLFDDENMKPIKEEQLKNYEAYILFYSQ